MPTITNNARRALGIPSARGAIVLEPGASESVTTEQADEIRRKSKAWIDRGWLVIDGAAPEPEPEEQADDGVEIKHQGGGRYRVFVSGIDVSQDLLDKDEAEALAAQYE